MTNVFPKKDGYYKANTVNCENGVTAEWDNTNWGLININAGESTKIKCNIDFKVEIPKPLNAVEYVTALAETGVSNEIVDDETNDHNLRYIGADPNNYVSFNGELWRIIGVMNDVADETGAIEPRIKLIRSEGIGRYAWNFTDSKGFGNEWTTSTLKELLNEGAYYNRNTGKYNEASSSCNSLSVIDVDFTSTGLMSETKSMISKVVWKLGRRNSSSDGLVSHFYKYERDASFTGTPISWTGKVGLMYASDYGYATGGGDLMNRNTCLLKNLLNKEDEFSDCHNNNWLKNYKWTLSQADNNIYSGVYHVTYYSNGTGTYLGVDRTYACYSYEVYPVVFLNTNLKITSGIGSSENPYILEA